MTANEHYPYLLDLVSEMGFRLRNAAITTSIQCIRCCYFSLEDALLKKHWTLQNVIDNMSHCDKILRSNKQFGEFLHRMEKEEMTGVVAHEKDTLEEYEAGEYEEEAKMKEKM